MRLVKPVQPVPSSLQAIALKASHEVRTAIFVSKVAWLQVEI